MNPDISWLRIDGQSIRCPSNKVAQQMILLQHESAKERQMDSALRTNFPQPLQIFAPGLLSHSQIHVLGLPANINQACIGKLPEMMRQGCPGNGNLGPQITAGDLVFNGSDPFKNFKPPAVNQGSRNPKQRPFVHCRMIPEVCRATMPSNLPDLSDCKL